MCAFLKAIGPHGPHGPRLLEAFEAQWALQEQGQEYGEARVVEVVMAEAPVQEDRGQAQAEEAPLTSVSTPNVRQRRTCANAERAPTPNVRQRRTCANAERAPTPNVHQHRTCGEMDDVDIACINANINVIRLLFAKR